MSQPTIQHLKPSDLALHPVVKSTPEWTNEDPRFLALVDDIRARGIDQPIQIDGSNLIMDGRHRWRAAKRLQLETVPVIRHTDDEAAAIVIGSLLHRRHYTPGQRAYILAPLVATAFVEARDRKEKNLKRGEILPNGTQFRSGAKTVEQWAEEIGVSERYLRQANELRDLFKDKTKRFIRDVEGSKLYKTQITFQDYFEPLILADENPMGLGAAKSGIRSILALEEQEQNGREHKGGRPKEKQRQIELLQETFHTLTKRFEYWEGFTATDKHEALEPMRETLAEMPSDMLTSWANAVRTEQRRRTKESDNE